MLDLRGRLLLYIIVLGVFACSFVLSVILNYLDVSPDLPQNPILGSESGVTATYTVEGPFQEKQVEITVTSIEKEGARLEEVVTVDGKTRDTQEFYLCPSTGQLPANSELYSFYWLDIFAYPGAEEQVIAKRDLPGLTFTVNDSTGLIGNPEKKYLIRVVDTLVWWSDTINSQLSAIAEVESLSSNGGVVARGIYNATCGQLCKLTFFKDGRLHEMKILESNFPHSKNREFVNVSMIFISILVMASFFVYAFSIRRKKGSAANNNLEKNESIQKLSLPSLLASARFLVLLALGLLAIYVNTMLDIWFYADVGIVALMAIHLLLLLMFAAACFFILGKDRIKYLIIGLLEIGIPLVFYVAAEPAIWPAISYFPGLLITWLILVFLEGYDYRER